MGSRRVARVTTLQILYLTDICRLPDSDAKAAIYSSSLDPKSRDFCELLTKGVAEKLSQIDEVIIKYAENWELKRMAAIDRNILRLAAYELLFQFETPVNVIIDEAVEIAKRYSTTDSGKFVNGILDKIKNDRQSTKPV